MKNCLVTKLKGTVDNEFLPLYDSAGITFLPHETNAVFSIIAPNAVLKLAGNAEIWDADDNISLGKVTTLGSSATHYYHLAITPCDSDCVLFITPKYGQSLPGLKFDSPSEGFDIGDLKYFSNIATIYLPGPEFPANNNVYGNINDINGAGITKLRLSSDNIEGDINSLLDSYLNKSSLTEFIVSGGNLECTLGDWSAFTGITTGFGVSTPKATGIFSSLASMPNLSRCRFNIQMPLITGSVEDFVAIAKLRGAGSLRIDNIKRILPNITYNGVPISTNSDVADGAKTISWDASGNITWS